MKKFFAAFLSALVGVFGYTLTDSAVEERISKLETEIVELRREVSSNSQLLRNAGSLEIGDFVKISSDSLDKMLLRENENGKLEFIHPFKIDQVKEDDIFVYLTDVTCQVTDFKTFTYNIEKGKNYEPDTVVLNLPVFSLSCKGYTAPSLSGKQISVSIGFGPLALNAVPLCSLKNEVTTSYVSSDGNFGFNADFSVFDSNLLLALIDSFYLQYGKEYTEKYFLSELIAAYYSVGLVVYGAKII